MLSNELTSSQLVDHHLADSPSGGHVALFVYPSSSQSPMLLKILTAKTGGVERELRIRPGWERRFPSRPGCRTQKI